MPGGPQDPDQPTPAQLAKAALRRLALARQEPTPENYAQAWAEECGLAAPVLPARARGPLERLVARVADSAEARQALLASLLQGDWEQAGRQVEQAADSAAGQSQAWAQLIERLTRGLERGGRQWTLARKKDSLQRVLDSSRGDMQRLSHRLRQLLGSWEDDTELPAEAAPGAEAPAAPAAPTTAEASAAAMPAEAPTAPAPTQARAAAADPAAATAARPASTALPPADAPAQPAGPSPAQGLSGTAAAPTDVSGTGHWPAVLHPLQATVRQALPADHPRASGLADELAALADQIARQGATPSLAQAVAEVCERAGRLLSHRHHLLEQVHRLSREMAGSLAEVAEDDSWVQGQMASLQERLAEAPNARAVQSASVLLAEARARQRELRGERDQARQALKHMIHRMLHELGELDQTTGRFSDGMQRYADTIERAESLESLAGVVREMVEEGRAVHGLVSSARARLHDEHGRAEQLEGRVRELETELRRLSDEASTDALTQIANRRGLMQAFELEQARALREAAPLAVGLLDIDNFKRLNDSLGHAAGDQALVALAEHVRRSLRPVDVVARYGGEEFVVLLPATPVAEAQVVLTRLQRLLSASLFMHDGQEVFVTFSAGVTAYRDGEAVEEALERADEALYEAKRTGKNRTCIG